jgi:hypothetical protein
MRMASEEKRAQWARTRPDARQNWQCGSLSPDLVHATDVTECQARMLSMAVRPEQPSSSGTSSRLPRY